jgi:hypothetical protein
MAVIKKTTKRIDHPSEPGEWAEIRVPVLAGDLADTRDDKVGMMLDLLGAAVTAWSYPEPVTKANIEALDIQTFQWLSTEVQQASRIRSNEEKKDSTSPSPATSEPEADASPVSSGT